jgi:sugar (pentulose or hexulose) kinase
VREAAGRGAALLAAFGTGAFASILELPAPPVLHEASPDPRHTTWYAHQRATFDSLHRILTPVSTSLAAEPVDGTALKEIA